jgi:diketogulonate reductase-like aldo/keto reductase
MTSTDPVPVDGQRAGDMPLLGLGTWQNEAHDECVESVRTAIEAGYRHVDTAQAYRNEAAVGEGIDEADVDRDEVFLATKVWISNLAGDDVRRSARGSLDRLGVDYVDLLYVHWPAGEYDPEETLPALAELVDDGLVRHAGVSNFEPAHVDEATEVWGVEPFANQIECHPFLQQRELRASAAETDMHLVAYSPLARGDVFGHPVLEDVAAKHDANEVQVSLAWLRQAGLAAIPKATSEAHIRDNRESLSLDLDDEDVERIEAIDRTTRKVDPDFGPTAWQ